MLLNVAPDASAQRTTSRSVLLVSILLGVVSTTVSAAGSWIPSLWGDEATSVLSAERPVPSLFWMLGRVDAVHGTYYLFLHYWMGALGASPFAVRFPSAIGAGIAVAGIVLLGNRLVNFRTGAFAGIVCVALPRVTYMGEEARGYAFSAALAVWLTLALVILLQHQQPKRRHWVAYGVGVALCAYVFLFSLLILLAHAIVILVARRPGLGRTWAKWTALGLVVALPVIVFGFFQRSQIAFLTDRTAVTVSSVFVGQWFGTSLVAAVCWGAIVASIVVGVVAWRRERKSAKGSSCPAPGIVLIGATWLLVPAVVLLSVNIVDPIYSSRYLTFAAPAASLLIGAILGRIRPMVIAGLLLIAFLAIAFPVYQSQRTPFSKNSSDWASVAMLIKSHAHAGDGMLFDEGINPSKNPRLGMRVYPDGYVGLVDITLKAPWWKTDYWNDSTYTLDQVRSRLDDISTVWLTEYRTPGSAHHDSYDLSTLASIGFHTVKTYGLHSNVVIELHRG